MSNDLVIKDLRVNVADKEILKGLNLTIKQGTIHAVMWSICCCNSTLSYTIAGHPSYEVTGGEVWYKDQNILELEADERSKLGLFLAFQYPVAIPGVTVANFLRAAVNAHRAEEGRRVGRRVVEEHQDAVAALKAKRLEAVAPLRSLGAELRVGEGAAGAVQRRSFAAAGREIVEQDAAGIIGF